MTVFRDFFGLFGFLFGGFGFFLRELHVAAYKANGKSNNLVVKTKHIF